MDAKTQITQDVFLEWRQKNRDDKIKQQEAVEADRKKKGIMTGREIFAQVKISRLTALSRGTERPHNYLSWAKGSCQAAFALLEMSKAGP